MEKLLKLNFPNKNRLNALGEELAIEGHVPQDRRGGEDQGGLREDKHREFNGDKESLKSNTAEEGNKMMKDKNKFSCVSCESEFRSKYLLSKHTKKGHGILNCKINQNPFIGRQEVEDPSKIHSSWPQEEQFVCEECDFSSPRLAFLRTHTKLVHTGGR